MVSFKEFLGEVYTDPSEEITNSKHPKLVAQQIVKNCQPLLEKVGYDAKFAMSLFRGFKNPPEEKLAIRHVRQDRKPVDTPKPIHDYIDQWFYQKFGHHYRSNALFAFGSSTRLASNYGDVHIVLPIGNFSFVWAPTVLDLFGEIRERLIEERSKGNLPQSDMDKLAQDNNKQMFTILDKLLSHAGYTDQNFKKAVFMGREIMINTDKYYTIPYSGRGFGYDQLVKQELQTLLEQ